MMLVSGSHSTQPSFLSSDHLRNMTGRETSFVTAFLRYNILVHFLEGSCSTSFIKKIDKDSFPSIISLITFPRRLNEEVQIRVLLQHFYLCRTQQNASLLRFPEGPKVFPAGHWSEGNLPSLSYHQSILRLILSSPYSRSAFPKILLWLSFTKPPTT